MGSSLDLQERAEFYGFTDPPFSLAPDPRFFFDAATHRAVLDTLTQSITHRRPITIVTGAHGSGKTMVCRTLVERLDGRTFSCYLPTPVTSFAELVQTMLVDFGVVSREVATAGRLANQSPHRLLGVLHDFLLSLVSVGAGAVLIVDEAHHLAGELLEEIRLLTNLETEDAALLPIVLVGRPELLDLFGDEETLAADPRIACRAELQPLGQGDVEGYIAHRLDVAQPRSRPAFHRRAIDAAYAFAGGSPRLVNQLCDRALAIGAAQRSAVINVEFVEQAADSLTSREPSSDGTRWSWRRLVAPGVGYPTT